MRLPAFARRMINEPSLARVARRRALARTFTLWQRLGLHVTPNDFYQPIPDTRTLAPGLWTQQSAMPGVDMNEAGQLALLETLSRDYRGEYGALPLEWSDESRFHINNGIFESVDAEVLYALIRHLHPQRMIEIGSGYSSLLSAQALDVNAGGGYECAFTAVEPYPSRFLRHVPSGRMRLLATPVQNVPLAEFDVLRENDILFIDSSHVVRIGSDVQYEFLEILPRLRPGVIVHIHDIFLPAEYPRDWVLHEKRFWNEQYILQALLIGSSLFEVMWGSSFMHLHHPDLLAAAFPSYHRGRLPASFWLRRTA